MLRFYFILRFYYYSPIKLHRHNVGENIKKGEKKSIKTNISKFIGVNNFSLDWNIVHGHI